MALVVERMLEPKASRPCRSSVPPRSWPPQSPFKARSVGQVLGYIENLSRCQNRCQVLRVHPWDLNAKRTELPEAVPWESFKGEMRKYRTSAGCRVQGVSRGLLFGLVARRSSSDSR